MPNHCLICFQEILIQMGWNDVISAEKKHTICSTCKSKLQEINGHTCTICNRPLDQLEAKYVRGDTCYDCVRWEEDPKWHNCLVKNQSLFQYNDFLQEVMARYKFRGDYILASLFSQWIIEKIDKEQFDYFVPIPLSPERLQERGFNQAEALIVESGFQSTNLLKRTHSEKQSKKSRSDRIHVPQVFSLEPATLDGKRILLFDDIYTTGSTLRHAAKILVESGAVSIFSITIARG